jgi:hypothetical protein
MGLGFDTALLNPTPLSENSHLLCVYEYYFQFVEFFMVCEYDTSISD